MTLPEARKPQFGAAVILDILPNGLPRHCLHRSLLHRSLAIARNAKLT